MTRLLPRLSVRFGLLACSAMLALAASTGARASAPDNTWNALAALPASPGGAILAIAADPSNGQIVLVGTRAGRVYASSDGGGRWTASDLGEHPVDALAFDPFQAGRVVAGLQTGGVFQSLDAGRSWSAESGSAGRTVRSFAFSKAASYAATDTGLLVQPRGASAWSAGGLDRLHLSSVAVAAVNDPVKIVAGADSPTSSGLVQVSLNGGGTWSGPHSAPQGVAQVAVLAAGPVFSGQDLRPLALGANNGLYTSLDNGADWSRVGDNQLPATDFSEIVYSAQNPQVFYAASDGGASSEGGVWRTTDGGSNFTALKPPVAAVTALAATADAAPVLYVATLRPSDQTVQLWSYHDTGGTPAPPSPEPSPVAPASPPRTAKPVAQFPLEALWSGPEGAYALLTLAAAIALAAGLVTVIRERRVH